MSRLKVFADARQVACREEAEDFLQDPSPAGVRALAERADELRFTHPVVALGVSSVAVKALSRVEASQALRSQVWAIHGSALRSQGALDAAEFALVMAAKEADDGHAKARAARRLATLRATQRRADEARALLSEFLDPARKVGGQTYGRELVSAGAILIVLEDFALAEVMTAEALDHLEISGDRIHLAAVFNLCRCRIEIEVDSARLHEAIELVHRAEGQIGEDYLSAKFRWLRARLQLRNGDAREAIALLQAIRPLIEVSEKVLDNALVLIDLALAHLAIGETESSVQTILQSFPLLRQLRAQPEAFQAIRTLQRAAECRALQASSLEAARNLLGRL